MLLNKFYNESPTKIKTRNKIINAAVDLFSQRGMEDVAMSDIAKVCQITSRNLYRYYSTKDFLVMDTAFYILNQGLLNEVNGPSDGKGIKQLKTYLEQLYHLELNNDDGIKFIRFIMYFDLYVYNLPSDNLALLRYIDLYRDSINDQSYINLSEIIKIGIKDGSITIHENEIEFYIIFIIQSLLSVVMRTMIKESENKAINGDLVEKQIEMMVFYLSQ